MHQGFRKIAIIVGVRSLVTWVVLKCYTGLIETLHTSMNTLMTFSKHVPSDDREC